MDFKEIKKIIITSINFSINVITEFFLLTIEIIKHMLPIFEKILNMAIKNLLLVILITILTSIPVYHMFPELFRCILEKLGLSLTNLSLFEEIEINKKEIELLTTEIAKLEKERQVLENKLLETKDLIENIKDIKIEHIHWWKIVLTISGITVCSGLILYFLLNGSDGKIFKSVMELVSKNTSTLISLSQLINENINQLSTKIHDIDTRIDILNHVIDSLSNNDSKKNR